MLRKTLIALFAAPFIVIILAVAAAMVALNWPATFINDTTLSIAARHLAPLGIRMEWKDVHTSSASHGAFDETLTISFDGLCVRTRGPLERACFSKLEASARYRFRGIIPDLVALGPISVEGGDILYRPAEKEEPEHEGALPIPEIRLPGFLARVHLFPIEVSMESFSVEGEGPVMKGTADLRIATNDDGKVEAAGLTGRAALPGGESVELTADATSGSNFTAGDWSLDARGNAGLGTRGNITFTLGLKTDDGERIDHRIDIGYTRGGMRGNALLSGTIEEESIRTSLTGSLDGASEFVPRITLSGCSLDFVSRERRKNRGQLDLSCPVDIKLKQLRLPRDIDRIYAQPKDVFVDISASADTFFYPDLDKQTRASLTARLRPQEKRLVKMHGGVSLELDAVLSEPMESWKLTSDADLDFTIDDFAKLVKALGPTPWPVPAPFNVLTGSLELSLEGGVSSEAARAVFPAKLRTKLSSPKQRIFLESDGELEVGLRGAEAGKMSLVLNVDFDDVQLELPDLSLAAIPSFTPDGRIVLNAKESAEREAEASSPDEFEYRLRMATQKGRPIRILSNLTPTFVPIALDVDLESEDMSGTVSIAEFPVKLFTRTATINHLDFKLQEPAGKTEVKGRISVPYIDITILIEIAGTVEHPSITLASKPPMSRGDIISTLMYGEPLDALDSDNASSVGSMNAAMANRAINLTSFFLLASTPIQSIGYNPETGYFTASVKLAKKTSIKVGASSETQQKEVGIRQRLGKGFSITTGWEKYDTSSQGAATAYIEWSKRY